MRILAVLLAFPALAGCAGVINETALPAAKAAYNLNMERCMQTDPGAYEAFNCIVQVNRQFAVDIKLKRMDLFEIYRQRMYVLYQDAVAKRANVEEVKARFKTNHDAFFRSIAEAVSVDQAQRQRAAAAFAAFGDAMERQADRQAYINAQNRPINCTSTAFGSVVNTRCN